MIRKSSPLHFLPLAKSTSKIGPCVLGGGSVRLEPLRHRHADALFEAGRSTDWRWFLSPLDSREKVLRRIEDGIRAERRGDEFAFAVLDKGSGWVIGSTSYLKVVPKHKRLEIGSTWYSKNFWGTVVNPECKFLLLRHAFEDWNAIRVELVTDVRNERSQRAILRLGASLEGRLRNNGVRPDGTTRDVFLYSIIDSEWPRVKSGLLDRLENS